MADIDDDVLAPEELPLVPPETPALALTAEHVASGLSVLARTGNGLAHAFTKLELHGLGITSLDLIGNYTNLRYVDLSDNCVKNGDGLAKLAYLLSVNLANNHLYDVPAALATRKFLQQANMAKNFLKEATFADSPMLVHLILNQNKLVRVTLRNLPELQIVEIRENRLETLTIENAPKLKHLQLSFNELKSIEGLSNLSELETLYVRNNLISSLDGFAVANKKLLHLNLRHNQISTFQELDHLKYLAKLRSINLSENPVAELENYRLEVLKRLPNLEKIDKDEIATEERSAVAELLKSSVAQS